MPLPLLVFRGENVAQKRARPHHFPGSRFLEALSGAFVCFQLWHKSSANRIRSRAFPLRKPYRAISCETNPGWRGWPLRAVAAGWAAGGVPVGGGAGLGVLAVFFFLGRFFLCLTSLWCWCFFSCAR